MKIKSYLYLEGQLQPVEVEVLSQKGIPLIQFVGLPDQIIKESAVRIKSAIKSCGFEWPQAKQIIVSLKPSHLKKSSQGLEFAVATAILLETEQITMDAENLEKYYFYGTLDLEGNVSIPEDLSVFYPNDPANEFLFTGNVSEELISNNSEKFEKKQGKEAKEIIEIKEIKNNRKELKTEINFDSLNSNSKSYRRSKNNFFYSQNRYLKVNNLSELMNPEVVHPIDPPWYFERPKLYDHIYLTNPQKELALISALGGHHMLLAGPAGSGKSLMADVIHTLKTKPCEQEEGLIISRYLKNKKYLNKTNSEQQRDKDNSMGAEEIWRPLIKPHHTISLHGLIGGGLQLFEGELSRANCGTMIFDELLEFKQPVVESLREPLETGQLRIVRTSGYAIFESRFQWIATTNLCPCGDFVPGKNIDCRYALSKCRSYSQKLSGPLLDRFELISFSNEWKGDRVHSVQSLAKLLSENSFFNGERESLKGNAFLALESKLPFVSQRLLNQWGSSIRRKNATLKIAYSLARLNERELPNDDDIERALDYTLRPFQRIQRWD